MKAIILNSGSGERLKPLTSKIPKCLVKINDISILEYQLKILTDKGIKEFVITTGPFEKSIKDLVNKFYSDKIVTFVKNPEYKKTNYIYSLWLARNEIDDDVLLLHGDLVFESSLVDKLLNKCDFNCIPINNSIAAPKKDFKALIENDEVKKIGVNIFADNAYFCAPIYKMSQASMLEWLERIDIYVNDGRTSNYAEDAFNEIAEKLRCKVLYFNDFCMEIDTISDLSKARKFFANKKF